MRTVPAMDAAQVATLAALVQDLYADAVLDTDVSEPTVTTDHGL